MATPTPSSSSGPAMGIQNPSSKTSLGFLKTAKRHRQSFFQFFAMTGILLISLRSLSQKYRLHNLHEDTYALQEEQKGLVDRMNSIKSGLLHEASLDSSGIFASRLRSLFADKESVD